MGSFITLISPDGGGKDTLFNRLIQDYPNAIPMYEPGGTKESDIIRNVLLDAEMTTEARIALLRALVDGKSMTEEADDYLQEAIHMLKGEGLSGEVEAFLYAASRAETNRVVVQPAVAKGRLVLGRRSVACSMSYQGYARGIGMDKIWNLNQKAIKGSYPTLEIYLDVPFDVAQERLKGRVEKQDRLDQESSDFHRKTIEGYHRFYNEYCPYPYVMVDGTLSKEDLYRTVKQIIASQLENM